MKSNIRKLRNERNLSQTELAEVIGKTQQTVSHMERDRDRISIEALIKMSEYFGVSTDYILGIAENETSETSIKDKEENKEDFVEAKKIKEDIDALKNVSNGGKLLYELVLSMLLCSLEDSFQPVPASKEEYG